MAKTNHKTTKPKFKKCITDNMYSSSLRDFIAAKRKIRLAPDRCFKDISFYQTMNEKFGGWKGILNKHAMTSRETCDPRLTKVVNTVLADDIKSSGVSINI